MEEDALAMPTGASEQPVSAAQAWAQKKAAALAKAQALRAARAKDVLGGLDHGDFLHDKKLIREVVNTVVSA